MGVLLQVFRQPSQHRGAGRIVDALGHGHDAAAVAFVSRLHVMQELLQVEHPLGQINQVRTVVRELLAQCRRGGQEPGVPAHHDADINAWQRSVVQIHAGKGLGHETRGRWIAWRVVVADQVVVDGLGDVDGAQRVARFVRLFTDDAHGIGRVVAANIEEMLDLVRAQHLEDGVAVFRIRFVARRAQGRGGCGGDQFEVVAGFLGQVDEVLIDDAPNAVTRPIYPFDLVVTSCLQRDPDHRLVDHRCRPTTLRDQNFSGAHTSPFEACVQAPLCRLTAQAES